MDSDAASQCGGWWQGCGAAYLLHVGEDVIHLTRLNLLVGVEAVAGVAHRKSFVSFEIAAVKVNLCEV